MVNYLWGWWKYCQKYLQTEKQMHILNNLHNWDCAKVSDKCSNCCVSLFAREDNWNHLSFDRSRTDPPQLFAWHPSWDNRLPQNKENVMIWKENNVDFVNYFKHWRHILMDIAWRTSESKNRKLGSLLIIESLCCVERKSKYLLLKLFVYLILLRVCLI